METVVGSKPVCNLRGARIAFTGKLLSMSRREARELVVEAGGEAVTSVSRRTSMLVIGMGGWPLLPDGQVSSTLRRAESLNRSGARIRILPEEEFLEYIGWKEKQPGTEKKFAADEICELIGIDQERLRRWEQLSLIRSCESKYDYEDLVSLQRIARLINQGVRPAVIHKSLRGLASVLPGTERPLTQLEIVLENADSLVAELDEYGVAADGQLTLKFDDHGEATLHAIPLPSDEPDDADSWFERGQGLEESERFEEARDAYHKAIALDPQFCEAYFNLGNVLRALDRPDAALELYALAAVQDPNLAEAWYNIADIYEERGALQAAVDNLERALGVSATYADAYYNLALCHEKLGDWGKSRDCWDEYLRLDPASEWANVARQHLMAHRG